MVDSAPKQEVHFLVSEGLASSSSIWSPKRFLLDKLFHQMASSARDISPKLDGLSRQVSNSLGFSTSPIATIHSRSSSINGARLTRATTGGFRKQLKPFATEDIKILLLENVNQTGRDNLAQQGYQVDFHKSSLPEDVLIEKIRWDA